MSAQMAALMLGSFTIYLTVVRDEDNINPDQISEIKRWYALRAFVFLTCSCAVSAAISLFVDENLRRTKFDLHCRESVSEKTT